MALPLAAGCGILLLIGVGPRMDRLAWWGWALGAGSLVTAATLWTALAFELPLEPGWMRLVLVAIAVAGAAIGLAIRRPAPANRHSEAPKADRTATAVAIVLALAVVTDTVAETMAKPALVFDESTNWTSKAKQLFVARGFNAKLGDEIALSSRLLYLRAWHPDYPNLVPMLHLWSYVNAGRIVHYEGRVPVLAFRYAIVLVLAGALLRRRGGWWTALLLVPGGYFVSASDFGADVVVALGFLVTVDGVMTCFETRDPRWWRVTALGATLLLGSKHDGAIIATAVAAACAVHCVLDPAARPRWKREAAWIVAPALAVASTVWFKHRFGLSTDVFAVQPDGIGVLERAWTHLGQRLWLVAAESWKGVAAIGLDARLPNAAFLVLIVVAAPAALSLRLRIATIAIVLSWAGLVLVSIGTPYGFAWFLKCSLIRVTDQWCPVICLWIGTLAGLLREQAGPGGRPSLGLVAWRLRLTCVAAVLTAAGPIAKLFVEGPLRNAREAARMLSMPEEERIADHLGGTAEIYDVVRAESEPSRAVVLLIPTDERQALDAYAQLTSLMFPKVLVPHFLGIGDPGGSKYVAHDLLLRYSNSLDDVLAIAGPEPDVLLEPDAIIPRGLELRPVAVRRHFVLARGRIRADVLDADRRERHLREAEARLAAERAESRRAETRRIAAERAATRRAEAERLKALRAETRRQATRPATTRPTAATRPTPTRPGATTRPAATRPGARR
jgi:hypothetical protein